MTFTTLITKPGIINVSEALDLSMDKLSVGLDLATVIDIKPIYFDYGKYVIRKDASAAYVKSRITNPERIYGKGYGESKLKNGCACEGTVKSSCSEAEHQENRRTEFVIIKM